jgi:hypothetical protein
MNNPAQSKSLKKFVVWRNISLVEEALSAGEEGGDRDLRRPI